ncbi:PepSY domain-containing protein [Pseudarthrobacter albicanus]|uniref:PepSY domain-containing protein n=1 Tax=Pseudarthrobacter albicanus TaxID=2823873 RepID=UPI001BA71B9F|nr:hypothetical protein [Pseudarthrobacter albicanus]
MRKKMMLITGAASAAVVLGGVSIAVAASQQSRDVQPRNGIPVLVKVADIERDDDSDSPAQPLSTEDRDKAGNAALAKVGQGSVRDVEREDDGGSAYEVEIRLNDGSEVEVQLGADFQVLNQGAPEHDDD